MVVKYKASFYPKINHGLLMFLEQLLHKLHELLRRGMVDFVFPFSFSEHGGQFHPSEWLTTDLKSGMPLAVLIPAPATTTMFLQRPSFTSRATEARPPRGDGLASKTGGPPWLGRLVWTGPLLLVDMVVSLQRREKSHEENVRKVLLFW